jgi:RHS repeat-associated protein
MGDVKALDLDAVHEQSGHNVVGMAVSVCITPAAPSPLPMPYPTTASCSEGISDSPLRTKIQGCNGATVGSVVKVCHGNEPGTLKEVVSLNTTGPTFPITGAFTVLCELGAMVTTTAMGIMNKAITPGMGSNASGAGDAGGAGGGGGGPGGSGPGSQGPSQPNNSGGSGGGDSSGAAPPNPPAPPGAEAQGKAGHPIDVATGAMYTIPAVDFELIGPLPLQWVRSYCTAAVRRNCGIGWGWSHPFAWRATIGSTIDIIDSQGAVASFPRIGEGQMALAPYGRRLERRDGALVLSDDGDEARVLRKDDTGTYRLAEVRDSHGNVTTVEWAQGQVCALTDCVGRRAERTALPSGESWHLVLTDGDGVSHRVLAATYEYDSRGDLVRAADISGATVEYRYDEAHFMIEERFPDGLVFYFQYEDGPDGKRRCVESWGAVDGLDVLAEIGGGRRIASADTRGLHHVRIGYDLDESETTVVDPEGHSHRFVTNSLGLVTSYTDPGGRRVRMSYDPNGRPISIENAAGGRSRFGYDGMGKLVSLVDPLGQTTSLARDARGNATSVTFPGGHRWDMKHDASGRIVERRDPCGVVSTCEYDERGLAVSQAGPGGAHAMTYDAHGNLLEFRNAAGGVWRYAHDLLGRVVKVEGPNGEAFAMDYDGAGRLVRTRGACDMMLEQQRDSFGNVTAQRTPGGGVEGARIVAGLVVESVDADGSRTRYGYDASKRLRWIENAARERYSREYDASGLVVRERTFAGLEYTFEYDKAARCSKKTWPDGRWQSYRRDRAGRVIAIEGSDGRVERFERDAWGQVIRASNDETSVTLVRDGLGRVVREVQSAGGWEFAVEHHAPNDNPVEVHRYSTGWSVAIQRTVYKELSDVVVREGDEVAESITFQRDERLREVFRGRKGDMSGIATRRDALGRPVEIHVGDEQGRLVRRRDYQWNALPGLTRVEDSERGPRLYDLDAMGRPRRAQGLAVDESFEYSAHGTPMPKGQSTRLGVGGRVEGFGDVHCTWDAGGRLRQKAAHDPTRSWAYAYDDRDRLVEAARGDGYRLRYLYDTFGRRLATFDSEGRSTWFGWDGAAPVEERRTDGTVVRRVFESNGHTPLLERGADGDWRLLATDAVGTPWFQLGTQGRHAELDLGTWGNVASSRGERTQLRFAGQRFDDETGLAYQRHRYYDPEIAQFTTADPLLLGGCMQSVGFVPNPCAYTDPLGLIIIIGVQPGQEDQELKDSIAARQQAMKSATGRDEKTIHAKDLYNPNTGKGVRLDNLPPGEEVEILSHGTGGGTRFAKKLEGGGVIANKLKGAGLQPGVPVHVLSCKSADPGLGRDSVVNDLHKGLGGANPVTGIGATSTHEFAGAANVRGAVPDNFKPYYTAEQLTGGPNGEVMAIDGQWMRAEGNAPATPCNPPARFVPPFK